MNEAEHIAWARSTLANADANEPAGSPGPGEVERAVDILAHYEET